jgi:hypothetical protein
MECREAKATIRHKLNADLEAESFRYDHRADMRILFARCSLESRRGRVISHQSAIGTTGTNHRSERCGPEKW